MKNPGICISTVLALALSVAACDSDDDDNDARISFLGDTVTVANTFEDSVITGGSQTIYGVSLPMVVSDPEVELPNFINFYDVDVTANTITLTLVNNSDAADLVLLAERFDRYYIGFSANSVTSAELVGAAELNEFATVSILPAGFSLSVTDQFATGIPQPVDFSQGGLLIEFGEGTDLTNTGVEATVSFN